LARVFFRAGLLDESVFKCLLCKVAAVCGRFASFDWVGGDEKLSAVPVFGAFGFGREFRMLSGLSGSFFVQRLCQFRVSCFFRLGGW
jgi:hypothetical protein